MSRSVESQGRALALRTEAQAARAQERQRALELLAHIRRNMGVITDAFYEVGTALTELSNNRLYLSLGHASFAELLSEQRLMSVAQAHKLIAVATLLPREAAVKLGPERSYALTRYARAMPATGGVAGLLQSGAVGGKRLDDLSVRDLAGMTRKARTRAASTPSAEARRQAERLARHAQALLRKRGLEGVTVNPVGSGGRRFRLELDAEAVQFLLRKV